MSSVCRVDAVEEGKVELVRGCRDSDVMSRSVVKVQLNSKERYRDAGLNEALLPSNT